MAMKIYNEIGKNVGKTWVMMLSFFLMVIFVGFVASQYFGSPAILYGSVIFSIVMNITSYWFSDKIVLASTRARPIDMNYPAQKEIHRMVENLAITAGLPIPRVYIVDDPSPNAFATGRNKDHAVVAVTTGILAILDKSELEGVLAHEMSHIGNRDILVSTVAVVLAGFVTIMADIFLRMGQFGMGSRDRDSRSGALFLVFALIASILAPLAANLMKLAISRRRESLADASGALLTRYPEALASALLKINGYGAPMKHVGHATAHLFISDPLKVDGGIKKASWFAKLFMTHPPVEERVAALRGMNVEAVLRDLNK
jgi:heat shock protein HtpX